MMVKPSIGASYQHSLSLCANVLNAGFEGEVLDLPERGRYSCYLCRKVIRSNRGTLVCIKELDEVSRFYFHKQCARQLLDGEFLPER